MGLAMDTILVSAVNPGTGAGIVGTSAPSGDSLQVRYFPSTNRAYMEQIIRMGTTAGLVQVKSPLLHDNVVGIKITPAESPSVWTLPTESAQTLQPQDTFTVTISGGAAETDIAALCIWYENLGGAAARLYMPGDIMNNIKYNKPISVAVTSSATIGAWVDTVITTTEDQTHANKDYAVLGWNTNTALGVIAVKGIDTGNLRAGGPGSTQEISTSQYFIEMCTRTGRPHIPVWNSANKNGFYVAVAAATASVAAIVELNCVELQNNMPPVN